MSRAHITLMLLGSWGSSSTRVMLHHFQLPTWNASITDLPLHAFGLRIYCEEGLTGLYSGLAPSMMGILHVAIQFPLYEALKAQVSERTGRSTSDLTPTELVVTSALSKMVRWRH